jgi:uncharacterized tellurite resistance protein B-like protein
MLAKLKQRLREAIGADTANDDAATRDDVELATAALLVEMVRADFEEASEEFAVVERLLAERFGIPPVAVAALVDRAGRRADRAVSLHEFTHLLNVELDAGEKLGIVEMMWRVSFADGRLDKHEEHLVRKVAGLLHVSNRDLIAIKLRIMEESGDRQQ